MQQATPEGRAGSVYVDPNGWAGDVHRQQGFACVDCHRDAAPSSHPVGGLSRPDCEICHAEACEEMARTRHALPHGTPSPPSCSDCHRKHSIRKKGDPRSSVATDSLVTTCAPCHASQATGLSWLDAIVLFRINGHKKEDISGQYDRSRCLDCHFREGAHSQPVVRSQRCTVCHGMGSGKRTLFSRSVHEASILGGALAGLRALFLALLIAAAAGYVYRNIRTSRTDNNKE